jgi:hypothetical protein
MSCNELHEVTIVLGHYGVANLNIAGDIGIGWGCLVLSLFG